uniref:sigma factor-like helix-turn-helix DNA-binding protein n=1 Tax=Alistipes putredinis TaxID=28117 RepID=UPI003FD79168
MRKTSCRTSCCGSSTRIATSTASTTWSATSGGRSPTAAAYHRHRRNATLPTERAAALADDSGDQELREEYERIAGLLATLPEEQAEVIRLKTSDSLTFARIAEITGTTEATVKSRFRYGIGKLRKLINH